MPYIDTQYLFKCETCRHCVGDIKCNTFCDSGECYSPNMYKIPTADVAPRAEVEKQVAKQKAMVLDAIDTFRNLLCIESYLDYEDTRPHYFVSIDDVNRIHSELKKKYTDATDTNVGRK